MLHKLKLQSIDEACNDCPFYKLTTKNKHVCAFKLITTPASVSSIMEKQSHFDVSKWSEDCGGSYDKCTYLSLFYSDESTEEAEPDDLDNYDPFDDSEESSEEHTEIEEAEEPAPQEIEEVIKEPTIKVAVHQIATPFKVKADVFVYPTNTLLEIDSWDLNQMTNFRIQKLCDSITAQEKIKMGSVYITTNGRSSTFKSPVVPKLMFHAVVAGPSKLVNEGDIKSATARSLELAEKYEAKVVVFYPFDCGTHDIEQTAIAQLSTIKSFLTVNTLNFIEQIHIVMEDEESYAIFTEYYKRVFKKR